MSIKLILCILLGYFLIGIIINISILVYDNLHADPYHVHEDDDDFLNNFVVLIWPALIPALVAIGINKLMIKVSDSITDIVKSKRNK